MSTTTTSSRSGRPGSDILCAPPTDSTGFIYSSYQAAPTSTHSDKPSLEGSNQGVAYVSSSVGGSVSTLSFEDTTRNNCSPLTNCGGGIRDRVRGFSRTSRRNLLRRLASINRTSTVRETVGAVKSLREASSGDPVTVVELARELKLDRSAVSRRVRSAKDRGYLRDLEENLRKPSRLVLGDDLPDDLQILPTPEDVRASMQKRASGSARPDGAQEPHRNGQNSDDAYKACNRVRVQEGIKDPPPPVASEPGDVDTSPDDIIEEVRNLFASDALEER
jgi:hypothetical protein